MGFYRTNKNAFPEIPLENGTYPAAVKSWKNAEKINKETQSPYPVIRFIFSLPPVEVNKKKLIPVVSKDVSPFLSKLEARKKSALTELMQILLGKDLLEKYQTKFADISKRAELVLDIEAEEKKLEVEYDTLFKAMLDSVQGKACSVDVEISDTGFKNVKKVGNPIRGMVVPVAVKQEAVPQEDFAGYQDAPPIGDAELPPPIDDSDIPF